MMSLRRLCLRWRLALRCTRSPWCLRRSTRVPAGALVFEHRWNAKTQTHCHPHRAVVQVEAKRSGRDSTEPGATTPCARRMKTRHRDLICTLKQTVRYRPTHRFLHPISASACALPPPPTSQTEPPRTLQAASARVWVLGREC